MTGGLNDAMQSFRHKPNFVLVNFFFGIKKPRGKEA